MSEILVVHGWINNLRARAAAFLVAQNQNRFDTIIFSWWKTGGKDNPSEAENMQSTFLARLRIILPELNIATFINQKIRLEEASCDTEENVQRIWEYSLQWNSITALSSASHKRRIIDTYKRYGIDTNFVSAERLFEISDRPYYKTYIQKYKKSLSIRKAAVIEVPLYILSKFQWWRDWIRSHTSSRIEK